MNTAFVVQRSSRLAVSAVFLAAGTGIGAWAACLPALSAQASLDKRELGIVLLCFALGAIAAMMSMGKVLAKHGTSLACVVCAALFGAVLVAVPYATGMAMLSVLVLVGGAAFGALDVAMNTEASAIERQSENPVMSSFHAVFSVGSLAGAGLSAQLLATGGDFATCLTAAGAAVIVLGVLAWMRHSSAANLRLAPDAPPLATIGLSSAQKRHLWLVGGLAFLALLTEGALMDWSAIYLVGTIGASESAGAFGFALFAGMMAFGRAIGDVATRIAGPERLLRFGAASVAAGLAAMLLFSSVTAVYVALAVCGLGISNVVPAVFSAAGRIGGDAAAVAMSRVTTLGYAGLLVGPPFIGFLAEATTLSASLWAVVSAAVVVSLGAGLVRRGHSA
jgi:predicted MFS family arabinose efflux permease